MENKILKQILFVVLFNVLPVITVISGFIVLSSLDNQNKSLVSKIEKEKINLKESRLQKINEELLFHISDLGNYNQNKQELNNTIDNINNQIQELDKQIKSLNETLEKSKNEYNNLLTQYNQVSKYQIKNISTINQFPNYPAGCEGVALTILLKYHGLNVDPEMIFSQMPIGQAPYLDNSVLYGGDPNYTFLGSPYDYSGWGIWDKGLAITANKFKSGVINGTGMDFRNIFKIIRQNRPVIVWTSIDLQTPFIGKTWINIETGNKIVWKNWNHAVVVIGYNENQIIISDPINGKIRYMNRQKFIEIYNYMGRKAIYY